MGIAAALMLIGGKKGRRAGVTGLVVAIPVASGVTNQGTKRMARRKRPDPEREPVVEARRVTKPTSTYFPRDTPRQGSPSPPLSEARLRLLASCCASWLERA